MITRIINDSQENWCQSEFGETCIISKGIVWIDGLAYKGQALNNKLYDYFGLSTLDNTHELSLELRQDQISKILGHFAFVVKTTNITLAVVDKVRSIPIYFGQNGDAAYISNNATKVKQAASLNRLNSSAKLTLEMAGYTVGSETLIEGLHQLTAGKYLLVNHVEKTMVTNRYFKYWTTNCFDKSEEELLEDLHQATLTTFGKMIESLEGRHVMIPLSGGYDSRLILAMFKEFKYDNFTTFTYGLKGVWEIKRAQYVAEKVNAKWHYIEYKPNQIRQHYYDPDRTAYLANKAGYASVPSLTPYFSIKELQRLHLLPDDAVIINGQSGDFTSGGHIPKVVEQTEKADLLSTSFLVDKVIEKHFSLWENLKTPENVSMLSSKIKHSLDIPDGPLSPAEFAYFWELHEWQERQSKFVVNGQRAYDWLGYDWRLPLWSDELMEYWLKIPWQTKFGQRLFLKYLNQHNFQNLFDIPLPPQFTYFPTWSKAIKPVFHILGKVSGQKKAYYYQKYLKYFMTYSPFYPQRKYFDYLKDSKFHRSAVSYWTKDYSDEVFDLNRP